QTWNQSQKRITAQRPKPAKPIVTAPDGRKQQRRWEPCTEQPLHTHTHTDPTDSMTDFIRTIWKATATSSAVGTAATANAALVPPPAPPLPLTPIKSEPEQSMERPVIKVEPAETSQNSASSAVNAVSVADALRLDAAAVAQQVSAATGKAQRAARRDAVNARRDKRKTMSPEEIPMSPVDQASADKSKKMKTAKPVTPVSSPAPVAVPAAVIAASPVQDAKNAPKKPSAALVSMMMASEIDASGEERLRALEAQLESLDPDSKEAKKKRRLIRNRMSAQLHRERKKAYVGQLEDQLHQKERELQLLQEKLLAMANESNELKKKLSAVATKPAEQAAPVAAAPVVPAARPSLDVPVIKEEPMPVPSVAPAAVISPAASTKNVVTPSSESSPKKEGNSASSDDSWEYCLNEWEDTEMADVATDDLLCDFDNPFASYPMNQFQDDSRQQHVEIHAAKKNIAMMMAVMFSVTFFGNGAQFFNLANGSNFSSMFNANPPKEFSQMSIASRIIACLEKTSWKNFRDLSSWTSTEQGDGAVEEAGEEEAVAPTAVSPSAISDTTDESDSCESPEQSDDYLAPAFESDLIDEFVYPVDDPFAPALSDANWLDDSSDFAKSTNDVPELFLPEASTSAPSLTSRLYEKLTTLWQEKNQVLLTVSDGKNTVQRSIADMSSIRKGMENGSWFGSKEAKKPLSDLGEDQSVTFLYPLSAFAPEKRAVASPTDEVFLEVSCQLNALKL
ncbi:TPA: hypothetical protein N0F65_007827, partial [Lagenidium giganteum]